MLSNELPVFGADEAEEQLMACTEPVLPERENEKREFPVGLCCGGWACCSIFSSSLTASITSKVETTQVNNKQQCMHPITRVILMGFEKLKQFKKSK